MHIWIHACCATMTLILIPGESMGTCVVHFLWFDSHGSTLSVAFIFSHPVQTAYLIVPVFSPQQRLLAESILS